MNVYLFMVSKNLNPVKMLKGLFLQTLKFALKSWSDCKQIIFFVLIVTSIECFSLKIV